MRLLAGLILCVLLVLFALTRFDGRGGGGLVDVTPTAPQAAAAHAGGTSAAKDPATPTHVAPQPAAVSPPAATSPATVSRPPSEPPASGGLLLPVQGIGVEQLHDTFTDARSEGRLHDAIDIMAPAGTPVLAVADGTIEKLFDSERGGLTIYQFEPAGRLAYYYAHLERYADGLAEGQPVRRGQVIGYVGSTGNADPAAPHLHFAIFVLGPEKRWWEGTAINPYPLLRGETTP